MKKFIIILIATFVFISKSYACQCDISRLDDSYRYSANVVSGKVTEVSTYKKDEALLKVTINVYEEFKGSGLTEFYILDPQKADGMCHMYIQKGQELLVYLLTEENGLPMTGYCARSFPLEYLERYPLELEILRTIKAHEISYISTFGVKTYENDFFREISKIKTNESIPQFGVFEVLVDRLNYWTEAKVIQGFTDEIDHEILQLAQKSRWNLDNYYSEKPLPTLAKFFLVIENDLWHLSDTYHLEAYTFH